MRPPQIRTIKRRINIHIRLHLARDQIGEGHNGRGGLVPQRKPDIVTFHQLRIRIVAQCDAIEHFLCQILLIRHVSRDGDGRERRRDGDVRGFGVDEEVDVGAEVFGEGGLQLVEVEVDVAAHDNEFFGGGREGAVEADGGGDVGQCALDGGGVSGDEADGILQLSTVLGLLRRCRWKPGRGTCAPVPP